MAISSSTRKAGPFLGNDATTVFPFAFKVFTAADLRVVNTSALGIESDLVIDVDYTVSLNSNQDSDPGGSVTRLTALPTGQRLTITSDVEALQPLVLTNNGGFYPRVINDAFDKITIIAQQLIEQVGRSLKLPISSSASATLPDPQPNGIIAWNSAANGFVNVAPGDLATVAGYADARVETFNGNGTQTAFVIAFNPGVLANLDISISGVTQVAGVDFTWTGTTITFTTAPPASTVIQVRYARPLTPLPNFDNILTAASDAEAAAARAEAAVLAKNLFPNTEWQLMNGIGPGWDGNPATLAAHLLSFDTEQNWVYTGNLPAVNVSNIAVSTDGSSGQRTITATCNDVQYCYPGQLIIFGASGAHASLLVSAMRIRTVNYSAQTVTFQAPRNGNPTAGAVSCSFRPVMRADMAGVTGNGPDGWTKTASAHLWLDRYPRSTAGMTGTPGFTSNLRPSNKRILVFRPASDADAHFYHIFPDPVSLRGQTISFGFLVDRVSNGTATPFIGGTTYVEGTQVVSSAGWTWVEMTYTVPDNCTELQAGLVFKGSGSDPWRIVNPAALFAASIGSGGYRPGDRGVVERFLVKQTPDSFHGADFSFGTTGSTSVGFGFKVDVFAETTGAIAEDVCMVLGQLEGSTTVSGTTPRAIATRNTFEAPQRYGHVCHAHVTGRPTGDSGEFDIHRADGTFWLYTNVSGAAWDDVSIDMNSAILRL